MSSTKLKNLIKKILIIFGYNIDARRRFRAEFFDQKYLLKNSRVIFDVGGHSGETIDRYRMIYENAKIYSFEPFKERFQELKNKSSFDRNIIAENLAISNETGTTNFYTNQASETNSLLPPVSQTQRPYHDHDTSYQNTKQIKADVETIDHYCKKNNVTFIDILKMDIQGGELNALKGAVRMLGEGKIKLVYCEVMFAKIYENQPLFHDIALFLNQFGYHLYKLYYLSNSSKGRLITADALFTKAKKY
jgi:FkbM family methyltransferase